MRLCRVWYRVDKQCLWGGGGLKLGRVIGVKLELIGGFGGGKSCEGLTSGSVGVWDGLRDWWEGEVARKRLCQTELVNEYSYLQLHLHKNVRT